jgi:hypothetical protein
MGWPAWWEWELLFPPHLKKRMEDRDFNEVELRAMLEVARGYQPDVVSDRWVIETTHRRRRWEVIVEPDPSRKRLVVITAYQVNG